MHVTILTGYFQLAAVHDLPHAIGTRLPAAWHLSIHHFIDLSSKKRRHTTATPQASPHDSRRYL